MLHTSKFLTERLCYWVLNGLDCSQSLYFSMHVKEKASKESLKHTRVGAKNRETVDIFGKSGFIRQLLLSSTCR